MTRDRTYDACFDQWSVYSLPAYSGRDVFGIGRPIRILDRAGAAIVGGSSLRQLERILDMIDYDSRTFNRAVGLGILADAPRLYAEPLHHGMVEMEADGLVERYIDDDGRKMIRITTDGRAALDQMAKGDRE